MITFSKQEATNLILEGQNQIIIMIMMMIIIIIITKTVKNTCRFLVESIKGSDVNQPDSKSLNKYMKESRTTKNSQTEGKFYKYGGKTQPWPSNLKRNKILQIRGLEL